MKRIIIPTVIGIVALLACQRANSEPNTPDTPGTGTTTTIIHGNTDVKIMSFNMRYDNSGDGANQWQYRRDRVANAVKFYGADVVGAQEVLENQLNDLKQRLPEYELIGKGRDDGNTEGEYNPLIINKNRFTVTRSGQFWLSATPDKVSKGWDGACNRIAVWAILLDKYTNKQIFVLNTHLDHVGTEARKEGVKLVLDRAKSLSGSLPVVITGDFNAWSTDQPIVDMKAGGMNDSREKSPVVYGPDWTWHDWKGYNYSSRGIIDYVFSNGKMPVKTYGVLGETQDGKYLSDHCPVLVTFELK